MPHFNDDKGYKGPGSNLGNSSDKEQAGSGVDKYDSLKPSSSIKDERKSDYRGPAGKIKTE